MENRGPVRIILTQEEAWELLSRCMNSFEQDNPTSDAALRKLARATQAPLLIAERVQAKKAG